ncbi:MAG: phosphoheptose isomerase family protein [Candidatus Latescibacterota bacterium]
MTAKTYIETLRKRFNLVQEQEDRCRAAAALIVERVLDGGALWVYDREEALIWEANIKAAGLFITNNQFTPEQRLTPKDVLLIGAVEPDAPEDIAIAQKARSEGAKVIAITAILLQGRKPRGVFLSEVSDIVIDNHSPEVFGILPAGKGGESCCPTSGVMNDCLFWALCAAVLDEFLARRKIPTVYRGVYLFAGREYNERAGRRFREVGY